MRWEFRPVLLKMATNQMDLVLLSNKLKPIIVLPFKKCL
jgi:hypothetical protein